MTSLKLSPTMLEYLRTWARDPQWQPEDRRDRTVRGLLLRGLIERKMSTEARPDWELTEEGRRVAGLETNPPR